MSAGSVRTWFLKARGQRSAGGGTVVSSGRMPCELCGNGTRMRIALTGGSLCIRCEDYLTAPIFDFFTPPRFRKTIRKSTAKHVVCRGGPLNGTRLRRTPPEKAVLGLFFGDLEATYAYDPLEDCYESLARHVKL